MEWWGELFRRSCWAFKVTVYWYHCRYPESNWGGKKYNLFVLVLDVERWSPIPYRLGIKTTKEKKRSWTAEVWSRTFKGVSKKKTCHCPRFEIWWARDSDEVRCCLNACQIQTRGRSNIYVTPLYGLRSSKFNRWHDNLRSCQTLSYPTSRRLYLTQVRNYKMVPKWCLCSSPFRYRWSDDGSYLLTCSGSTEPRFIHS